MSRHLQALNRFKDAMLDDVLSPLQVAQMYAASAPYAPSITAMIDLLATRSAQAEPSSHASGNAGESSHYQLIAACNMAQMCIFSQVHHMHDRECTCASACA